MCDRHVGHHAWTAESKEGGHIFKGAVARTKAIDKETSVSPKPNNQNDDIGDYDADENERDYTPHFLIEAEGAERVEKSSNAAHVQTRRE